MAPSNMYIVPGGAGLKNGTSWANAFSLVEWEVDIEGSAEAGDKYFVKEGTYTLTSDIYSAKNGTVANNIKITGVKAATVNEPPVASDYAVEDERPYIDAGASRRFQLTHYWDVRNMRFKKGGNAISTYAMRLDTGGYCINCKFENTTTGIGDSWGLYNKGGGGNTVLKNCEFICTKGFGVSMELTKAFFCYSHNSRVGYQIDAYACIVAYCIAANCTESGIYIPETSQLIINNCTIDTCVIGIDNENGATTSILSFFNNIISNNTSFGINFDVGAVGCYGDYNHYYNNGADVNNVTKGANDTAGDPKFKTPGSDFELDTGSPCLDAGMSITLGV